MSDRREQPPPIKASPDSNNEGIQDVPLFDQNDLAQPAPENGINRRLRDGVGGLRDGVGGLRDGPTTHTQRVNAERTQGGNERA